MEKVNDFLSSSTIHGLAYIPTSRGLLRLFWVLVVVSGFSTAAYLIVKSFRGWQESPISTSIEVLPITEMTFPNVTVCPPRDTLTLLNYDLRPPTSDVEDEARAELVEAVLEFAYQEMFQLFSKFKEADRYRHWYEGSSDINLPHWNSHFKDISLNLKTFAQSGEIVTPHYGDSWEDDKYLNSFYWTARVLRPWTDNNVSVVFHVDQDILATDHAEVVETLPSGQSRMTLAEVETEENFVLYRRWLVDRQERDKASTRGRIPGFRVSWEWRDNSSKPDRDFLTENAIFVRRQSQT